MKIESYKNDPLFLIERHMAVSKKILKESCEGLTVQQRQIVEGIYNEFVPLIRETALLEQTLTADQIKQLFANIEQGATAAGGNRTALGKGKDVVGKANDIINKVGTWLQNTTPVQAFDQKFEDLKARIKEKLGGDDSKIVGELQTLGELAKENPGKTAAIVGILTAIASVAGGPIGGAIAGQVLRGSVELLKGEKISTAVGKGLKTAALGFIAGAAVEKLGDWLSGLRADVVMQGKFADVSWNATKTMSGPGWEWSRNIQGLNIQVLPEDAQTIDFLMDRINQGGATGVQAFDKLARLAEEIRSPEYGKLLQDVGAIARDNDKLYQIIQDAKVGLQAASQGAVAGAGVAADGQKKSSAPTESLKYNLRPLTEAQCALMFSRIARLNHEMITEGVIWEQGNEPAGQKPTFMQKVMGKAGEIGKNLTTKTTASKLMSAWKKAGSISDSDGIAEFLKQQGVNDQVIAQTFKDMQLPAPGTGKTTVEIAALKKEILAIHPDSAKKLLGLLTQKAGAPA